MTTNSTPGTTTEYRSTLSAKDQNLVKDTLRRLINVRLTSSNTFTLSDLVGKGNADWNGGTFQCVYDAVKSGYPDKSDAEIRREAAKRMGKFLREVTDEMNKEGFNISCKTTEVKGRTVNIYEVQAD